MPPMLLRACRLAGRRGAALLAVRGVVFFFFDTVFFRAGALRPLVFFMGRDFLFGAFLPTFLPTFLTFLTIFLVPALRAGDFRVVLFFFRDAVFFFRTAVFFTARAPDFFFDVVLVRDAVFFRAGLRLFPPTAVVLRRVPVIDPTPVRTCLNRAFIPEASAECKPRPSIRVLQPTRR